MNSVLHVPGNAGAFNYHLPPASNVPYQVQQLNWPEPVPYQPNPAPAQPAAVPDTTNKQTNSHERVSASVPEEVKPRPAQVLVAEAVKPDNALLPDGRVRISKACDAWVLGCDTGWVYEFSRLIWLVLFVWTGFGIFLGRNLATLLLDAVNPLDTLLVVTSTPYSISLASPCHFVDSGLILG
jgi:hypothetical protein